MEARIRVTRAQKKIPSQKLHKKILTSPKGSGTGESTHAFSFFLRLCVENKFTVVHFNF